LKNWKNKKLFREIRASAPKWVTTKGPQQNWPHQSGRDKNTCFPTPIAENDFQM